MMESASPLQRTQLGSRLASQSKIKPAGNNHRRTMVAGLMLTSLVDAFSILVIFLIMNHSANQDVVNLGDKLKLPQAKDSQFIQEGVEVRVEGGKYFIENKPASLAELIGRLKGVNQASTGAKKSISLF